MKILILTQVFYPDTVSVAQHLTDLARFLSSRGHEVTVVTSNRSYEDGVRFTSSDGLENINIVRIGHLRFSKKYTLLRAISFLTFNFSLLLTTVKVSKGKEVVLGSTSPPFAGLIALFASRIFNMKFYFWVMDLQPELAIAAGVLKPNSISAKVLRSIGAMICKGADQNIVMDRFMRSHLLSRGVNGSKIRTVPVWPVSLDSYDGARGANPFREENNYGNKIVLMYSGNHALVHPLETILDAARRLSDHPNILFSFVGGGVRVGEVTKYRSQHQLDNIVQEPFQPRETFHISIAASDMQLVVLGQGQVGFTHPNKIYGAMYLGKPILYVGPKTSHVTDILGGLAGNIVVEHGEGELLAERILEFAGLTEEEIVSIGRRNQTYALANFSSNELMTEMVEIFEGH